MSRSNIVFTTDYKIISNGIDELTTIPNSGLPFSSEKLIIGPLSEGSVENIELDPQVGTSCIELIETETDSSLSEAEYIDPPKVGLRYSSNETTATVVMTNMSSRKAIIKYGTSASSMTNTSSALVPGGTVSYTRTGYVYAKAIDYETSKEGPTTYIVSKLRIPYPPSCQADTTTTACDIKITNKNSFKVNVYISGAYKGNIAANASKTFTVANWDTNYNVYFSAAGYDNSSTTTGNPGSAPNGLSSIIKNFVPVLNVPGELMSISNANTLINSVRNAGGDPSRLYIIPILKYSRRKAYRSRGVYGTYTNLSGNSGIGASNTILNYPSEPKFAIYRQQLTNATHQWGPQPINAECYAHPFYNTVINNHTSHSGPLFDSKMFILLYVIIGYLDPSSDGNPRTYTNYKYLSELSSNVVVIRDSSYGEDPYTVNVSEISSIPWV